ncbi:cation:proton antiporter domain-containing protein [Pseudohaliea rubra]|uniref:Putative Glutathione-regulated potassium-efflux system protein KefB n=1 Tax=Pseudohaliea rubra DSM 19751 TaxID=1265313 RepID=A0A095VNW7_9GAMM|nr:cation:proton antiporter [Pseudohaliea rubra]KGE02813.1 putative Glutathione-regulated potassium-efflux system protein KefB [Pseudohaliea rubra DSM 19751]
MIDPLIILTALATGMLARAIGLPALVGYLGAGFVLHELDVAGGDLLQVLADAGVTLLLFTIGLKLQLRDLFKSHIWGTTVLHMAATQLFFLGVLWAVNLVLPGLGLDLGAKLVIAFAFTFSSTVFVIQIMQERGEMASRHANLAIGVLIIQDLAAVLFLAFTTGKVPQPAAILLLLAIPLRPLVLRLLALAGHGELFTLFGLALAFGSAGVCEAVGIKGDLGALVIGAILAGDQKAKELSYNLLLFKDLFLVGFFLSIGLGGWPAPEIIALAAVLGALALLKPLLYFPILTWLHTPPRTALLASNALANHSEFGLIVIAVAATAGWVEPVWSAALSIAIAVSFILAAPLNGLSHSLYRRHRERLARFESTQVRATRGNTDDVRVLVLGMGNIGTGAYETLAQRYGWEVLGVDDNDRKLAVHRAMHRRVEAADASDPDFWARVDLNDVELILLALTNHQENMLVVRMLDRLGYRGEMAAVVRFAEEARELERKGISVFNLFAEAGAGFGTHAIRVLDGPAAAAKAEATVEVKR